MPDKIKKNDNSIGISEAVTKEKAVSLKDLAASLKLSPTTISLVLNSAPTADSIPQTTQDRIFEAAAKYNYRPNYFARSLRAQRSFTIGMLVPELSDGYSGMVLNGVEATLSKEGFFYLTASHLHHRELLENHPKMLIERQVEGIIAIDSPIHFQTDLPVVTVSGHDEIKGVTNVVLNHQTAAELGIKHLFSLGHRQIAFIKG
ncbi:MAG: LacI family transcriptional regulator, partial [Acidobacteriota bacterium]|nr:LacI family transcriptional regulator [Acidobacteriota bacterium]